MSLKRKKMDLSWAWVGLGYGIAIIWVTLLYSLLLKKKNLMSHIERIELKIVKFWLLSRDRVWPHFKIVNLSPE